MKREKTIKIIPSRWRWLMRTNAFFAIVLFLLLLIGGNWLQVKDFILNELPATPKTQQEAEIRAKHLYRQWIRTDNSSYHKILLKHMKKWHDIYPQNETIKQILDKVLDKN